jgi:F-type H+-transporting ATPase subunit b
MAAIATSAPAGAEHASGGLPQFDLSWWPGEIVWTLVIFAVLFVLFAKVFVPRVGGTIALREDRISGDIGEARRLRAEADAQHAQALAELAQARAQAQKLAVDARNAALADAGAHEALEQAKLAELISHAEIGITATRDQAMTHVRDIAAEAAGAVIAKLTGKSASAAELTAALRGQA